jgi:hypothetical protein
MSRSTFLFVLLGVWALLAIGSVGYNAVNTVSEVKNWYFLTDTQKREKLFGDLYTFFTFIDKNTPADASILIKSFDVRTFFLGRYYLYPKKITVGEGAPYIASFGSPLKLQDYVLIETCSMKEQKGFLYKKR